MSYTWYKVKLIKSLKRFNETIMPGDVIFPMLIWEQSFKEKSHIETTKGTYTKHPIQRLFRILSAEVQPKFQAKTTPKVLNL